MRNRYGWSTCRSNFSVFSRILSIVSTSSFGSSPNDASFCADKICVATLIMSLHFFGVSSCNFTQTLKLFRCKPALESTYHFSSEKEAAASRHEPREGLEGVIHVKPVHIDDRRVLPPRRQPHGHQILTLFDEVRRFTKVNNMELVIWKRSARTKLQTYRR